MNRDQLLVAADKCEEEGYSYQAGLLRALAAGNRRAYVVVQSEVGYDDSVFFDEREPQAVYLDAEEARNAARKGRSGDTETSFSVVEVPLD